MTTQNPCAPEAVSATENWVAEVVVRHRLCPFAKPVLDAGSARYTVLEHSDAENVLNGFAEAVSSLVAGADRHATTLLILTNHAGRFDDFLDLIALADALLESMQWDHIIQLANFHPDYCFADTAPEAIENFTNRSPWPVIQLLQVDAVSEAIDRVVSTDHIPARNIETLQNLDEAEVRALIRASTAAVSAS